MGQYAIWKLYCTINRWSRQTHLLTRSTSQAQDDPESSPLFSSMYMKNRQGMWLFTQEWLPSTKSNIRGVVFLVHGMGEHLGRYSFLAQELRMQGYAVFAMDHQGHGRSEGCRLFVEKFQDFATDYVQFITRVLATKVDSDTTTYADLPRFIIGHSMGGAVTLAALERCKSTGIRHWDGIVLSAPALKADPNVSYPAKRMVANFVATYLPKFPVTTFDENAAVSKNQIVKSNFIRDPLVPKDGVTARLAVSLLDTMDAVFKSKQKFHYPLLMLHGTDDNLVCPDGSREFVDSCASVDKELKLYDGLSHEVLNSEIMENIVKNDVIAWINNRCAKKN